MKRIAILFVFALATTLFTLPASAQETTSATDELMDLVGKAIVEETTQRSEEVKKAKEILDVVLQDKEATEQEKTEAEKKLEEAEKNYAESEKKLDQAKVDALAERSGKSPAEIQAMRDSGMGWGKIAKETGVHPSALGKGKGKDKGKGKSKSKGKMKSEDDDDDDKKSDDEDDDKDKDEDDDDSKGKKNKGKGKGKKK